MYQIDTDADNLINQAKDSIKDAYKYIHRVLDPNTNGFDEFTDAYKAKINEVFAILSELKTKL